MGPLPSVCGYVKQPHDGASMEPKRRGVVVDLLEVE
jgi:hypothetical protein